MLHERVDPLGARKREKLLAIYNGANAFGDIAKEYIDKMVAEGRADTTTTKANWLLEQLKPIAGQAVADLKPIDVLAALKRIEARGKYETARHCRSFASRVFRYEVAHRSGRGRSDRRSAWGADHAKDKAPWCFDRSRLAHDRIDATQRERQMEPGCNRTLACPCR
jgi:hypothetical protein